MTLCPQLRRLSAEHARWLADVAGWASAGQEDRVSRLLALWEMEVLPHCRAEEEVLLPELASRLSEADAAIVFTLSDHVALRRLARELQDATDEARGAALTAMEKKLEEHARFEERTLFPAVQEALGCDRIAGLAPDLAAAAEGSRLRPTSSAAQAASNAKKGRKS
jgi:iron-sulfur cluster repair protein YtfE (RIC family)